jgi:hypothetical protein
MYQYSNEGSSNSGVLQALPSTSPPRVSPLQSTSTTSASNTSSTSGSTSLQPSNSGTSVGNTQGNTQASGIGISTAALASMSSGTRTSGLLTDLKIDSALNADSQSKMTLPKKGSTHNSSTDNLNQLKVRVTV